MIDHSCLLWFGILSLLVSFGCKSPTKEDATQVQDNSGPKAIARVFDNYLYSIDIAPIAAQASNKADSAQRVDMFIKSWINQQLMIAEAQARVKIDLADIEQKLQKYKYDLMVHELHKVQIESKVNNEINEDEIVTYYNENKSNFELKGAIVKGYFIKLPLSSPRISRLDKLLKQDDAKSKQEMMAYCSRYSPSYNLDDSIWINFDEMAANTPFVNISNKVSYLKSTKIDKSSDDEYYYVLKIKDFKITDEIAPLDFAREQIKKIIVNRRKLKAIKELESEIMKKAEDNNVFEIYK